MWRGACIDPGYLLQMLPSSVRSSVLQASAARLCSVDPCNSPYHPRSRRQVMPIRTLETIEQCGPFKATWDAFVSGQVDGARGLDFTATLDWTLAVWEVH